MAENLIAEDQSVFFHSSEQMNEIPNTSIDFIMTSPPYWNLKDYNHKNQIGQEDYERYLDRLNSVWQECYRVSKKNSILAINVNSRRNAGVFYPIAFDIHRKMINWRLIDILIWYIPNALPQPNHYIQKLFDNKFEFVLIYGKNYDYKYTFNKIRVKQKYFDIDPRAKKMNAKGRCIGNVVRIPAYRPPTIKKRNYHIAAYPEELVYLLMHAYSDAGDFVLDPFLGSGTTLKVAQALGRKGYGYELNSGYKNLIYSRINEKWAPPSFESLDILHSSTNQPGMNGMKRRGSIQRADEIDIFSLFESNLQSKLF